MNRKFVLTGAVGVLVIAGAVFLFTGKKAGGKINLETGKVSRATGGRCWYTGFGYH